MTLKEVYYALEDKGLGYFEAQEKLKEECIEKKLYSQFLKYILKEHYEHTEYADSFLKVLLREKEFNLFKIYWKTRLSDALKMIWEYIDYYRNDKDKRFTTKDLLSYDRKLLNENADKYPARRDDWLYFVWHWYDTLDFTDRYIKEMQKINATEDIERAKFLKECVFNLKKPRAKKSTDKKKMSEELFWELIQESRDKSEFDSDFTEILKDKLEAMSATEIKKFQKLLLEKMNELNHWDIWALAYIVRKGCGDDAFDYFKAWVISKGKEAFEDVKDMKLDKLKKLFQESDPQLEEFMYVAQNAYADKKYDEMPIPRVKNQPIQGEEWNEEEVCKSYPKICEMFGYTS